MAERRYLRYRILTQQSCKTVVMSFSFLTFNLTDDSPVFKLRFTLHFITFITLHYSERNELVRECIMGNWKIENGKYATRVPDEALYEFYECSVFFIMI